MIGPGEIAPGPEGGPSLPNEVTPAVLNEDQGWWVNRALSMDASE